MTCGDAEPCGTSTVCTLSTVQYICEYAEKHSQGQGCQISQQVFTATS